MKTYSIKDLYASRNEIADIALSKGACEEPPQLLKDATNNVEAFKVIFDNYDWLIRKTDIRVKEIESITRESLSPWYIWLLETHCLDKGDDDVVIPVINLHKRVIAREVVEESEWTAASDAAREAAVRYAAMYAAASYAAASYAAVSAAAASAAARYASWSASSDASWSAARYASWSVIIEKLYEDLTK